MKVKALKTFLSGKFSAVEGEVVNSMPERKAQKLITIGFVEEVKDGEDHEGENTEDAGKTPEEGQKVEEKQGETKKPQTKKSELRKAAK